MKAALGDMGCVWSTCGCFLSFEGCFGGVGRCIQALRVIWECFLLNSHQYTWCPYKSTDIFLDVSNIEMSQCYGHFDLLASLKRSFRASAAKLTALSRNPENLKKLSLNAYL